MSSPAIAVSALLLRPRFARACNLQHIRLFSGHAHRIVNGVWPEIRPHETSINSVPPCLFALASHKAAAVTLCAFIDGQEAGRSLQPFAYAAGYDRPARHNPRLADSTFAGRADTHAPL